MPFAEQIARQHMAHLFRGALGIIGCFMSSTIKVMQHQYAIRKLSDTINFIATNNIWICTGFYGWYKEKKIAFLCHFDHP